MHFIPLIKKAPDLHCPVHKKALSIERHQNDKEHDNNIQQEQKYNLKGNYNNRSNEN